jgi:hypothetical protein
VSALVRSLFHQDRWKVIVPDVLVCADGVRDEEVAPWASASRFLHDAAEARVFC